MMSQRLGLSLPNRAMPLPTALELVLAAEKLGYREAWTDEVDLADAMTPLAWLAARSDSLRLGVGVVPATTRPPALLAMTASALQQLSGGRLTLGIGASTPNVLQRWMGLARNAPVEGLEETIEVLRLIFMGEVIDYPGQVVSTAGFSLKSGPCDIPLYIGAHGRRTLALAGASADGVVLGNVAADWVPAVLADVERGAVEAGRAIDELDVVCRVVVGVNEDEEQLMPSFRRTVASYASAGAYRSFFARMGWGPAMEQIAAAWQRHDGTAAAAAVPLGLVDKLFIVGSPSDCAARLRQFTDAGVRSLVIVPASAARGADKRAERTLEGLRELAALLAHE